MGWGDSGDVCIYLESVCMVYSKLVTSREWDGRGGSHKGNQETLLFTLMLHISVLLEYFYNAYILLL